MKGKKIGLFVAGVLAVGVLTAAGCSDDTQLNDAPVGKIDDKPVFVMTNADEFPNIAARCYGVNGMYTTTRAYDALTVIANDPQCGGDPKLTQVSG